MPYTKFRKNWLKMQIFLRISLKLGKLRKLMENFIVKIRPRKMLLFKTCFNFLIFWIAFILITVKLLNNSIEIAAFPMDCLPSEIVVAQPHLFYLVLLIFLPLLVLFWISSWLSGALFRKRQNLLNNVQCWSLSFNNSKAALLWKMKLYAA